MLCARTFSNVILIGLLICTRKMGYSYPCDEDMSIEIGEGDYILYSNRSLLDTRNGIQYEPSFYWETETKGFYRACVCQLRTCIRKCCAEGEAIVGRLCAPSNSSLVQPFTLLLHDDSEIRVDVSNNSETKTLTGEHRNSKASFDVNNDLEIETLAGEHHNSKTRFAVTNNSETRVVVSNNSETRVVVSNNSNYVLLTGFPGCAIVRGKFIVDPATSESDEFWISKTGILHMLDYPIHDHDISSYCLEAIIKDDDSGSVQDRILPVLCFPPDPPEPPTLYKIGQVVSIPFLLVTFLVFACVQELRNYHGKSLMCYVSSLLVAFASLSFVQFQLFELPPTLCLLVASTIQFSFLAAFFWLNSMCLDIWWTFSGFTFRGVIRNGGEERTKFIICSLYAWGCPFIICSATVFVNLNDDIFPDWIDPNFGFNKCWFNSDVTEMIYFYGPVGILLSLNVLMFIMTTFKICSSTRETAVLRHRDSHRHQENERQRFFLYLKLFVLMGANWIMEVVSWFLNGSNRYVWYITDLCDTLTGVIIFVLFVCTRKTLRLVSKKMGYNMELFKESSTKTSSSKLVSSSSAKERDNESLRQVHSDSLMDESAMSLKEMNADPKLNGSSSVLERIHSDPKINGSPSSLGQINGDPKMSELVS